MSNNVFSRARLKLAGLYVIFVIVILIGGFALNPLLHKVLAKPHVALILHISEFLAVILVGILCFYFASRTLWPLEAIYETQKRFLADVSQELRTPLSILKISTETVLSNRRSTKADYKKLAESSLEEIDYMTSLVKKLLFLAEQDNPQTTTRKKINLSELVTRQATLIAADAITKNVKIKQDCKEDCFVYGNVASFKHVITNILQNAVNFNTPGGTINVYLHNTKKGVELTVSDTGIGIAKNDLSHIFERFYKVDSDRSYDQGAGAGLGLALVQEIVKASGGDIYVQSRPKRGTVMTTIFPGA
jgi:signal transduction histidine kinase